MSSLRPDNIRYMPVEQVAEPTKAWGPWELLADRWWVHKPGAGLVFYGRSPQCNGDEKIARKIQATVWPDLEVIFVPRVFLLHHCEDYR